MKKLISLSILLASVLAFTGCAGEEENLFAKSAADRLNEASALYSNRLMASPNGWAMQLYPTYKNEAPFGSGYLLLCDFNADHTVKVAMNNSLTGNKYSEDTSLWEVITDNGPVLTFNSYNKLLHFFSSPEDVKITPNDDETGKGIEGDYEFIVVDAPEDGSRIMLKGKKRGTYNLLTPMENGVSFEDYLADVNKFQTFMFPTVGATFNTIDCDGKLFKMEGAEKQIANIYPFDGDAVIDATFNPLLVTKWNGVYHLRFRDKIKVSNQISVQDFAYNAESDKFVSVDNDKCVIYGSNPIDYFIKIIKDGGYWIVDENNNSPYFSDLYKNLVKAFKDANPKSPKNNLEKVTINFKDDNTLNVIVAFKTKYGSSKCIYYYGIEKTEKGLKIQYSNSADQASENRKAAMPELSAFLDALSQEYIIVAAKTRFNMESLKLTSASNADDWFNIIRFAKLDNG